MNAVTPLIWGTTFSDQAADGIWGPRALHSAITLARAGPAYQGQIRSLDPYRDSFGAEVPRAALGPGVQVATMEHPSLGTWLVLIGAGAMILGMPPVQVPMSITMLYMVANLAPTPPATP